MVIESINNTDNFREALSESERPVYDMFLEENGRKPEHMWELMNWAVYAQTRPTLCETLFGFKL